jgi:hypothetical protein
MYDIFLKKILTFEMSLFLRRTMCSWDRFFISARCEKFYCLRVGGTKWRRKSFPGKPMIDHGFFSLGLSHHKRHSMVRSRTVPAIDNIEQTNK